MIWIKSPMIPCFCSLLAYSVVLLLKYRCKYSKFVVFCGDVDGCGQPSGRLPWHVSVLYWGGGGARSPWWHSSFKGFVWWLKKWGQSSWNIFCWFDGRAPPETEAALHELIFMHVWRRISWASDSNRGQSKSSSASSSVAILAKSTL